ncbi:MAG: chalcone isomerase family protein [Myxococcales bacterium]|nr:chalcone isomerase family protein [Myxococcales bacterium]
MRLIALVILALYTLPLTAKEREGVTSQPTITAGGKELHLMGMGLRKKLFFKVYIASFYLETPTDSAAQAISSDQVKRVEMHMLRDLERGKIVEAVQAGFEKNSAPQMPQLQQRLDAFLEAIPDLKSGESIAVTYVPGQGTIVKAGGSNQIVIRGKDFADALFSVWLGPHPVDDDLKDEMLKNR